MKTLVCAIAKNENLGNKKNTLSVCLIVKNEAPNIKRCLDSLSFADEIIIYDTGSEDGTQDICRENEKVKLYQGYWDNDFSRARNASFSYATSDYIMWVDADDVIDEQSQKWLSDFKGNGLSKYDIIYLEYKYNMDKDGNYSRHFYRERIFNKDTKPYWSSPIHEYTNIAKSITGEKLYVQLNDCSIGHLKHSPDPMRNINIFRDMESKNKITDGRNWFYYARESNGIDDVKKTIQLYEKAISCSDIWSIDKLNAYMDLSKIFDSDKSKALEYALMASIQTKIPRADVCCRIGKLYLDEKKYSVARHYYLMALENRLDGLDNTFLDDRYLFLNPTLQLCVIEDRCGNYKEAEEYNNKVLEKFPQNESALYNRDNVFVKKR